MSAPAPRVGDVIAGKYRIERALGEGGMALVFAANHLALGRSVALKFVRPSALGEDEARQRFMREAHATFSLRSEHAVRMLDLGELPSGDLFLVMELLDGQNLADVIHERAPLPEAEVARFIRQACDAIGEAHALGIVHRDLKPANLFLTRTHTGKFSVKVLDFGLVKIDGTAGPGSMSPLTGIATTLGTPKYMAPEQWERSTHVDGRADIYSLGVILFQLLTKKVPHEDLPLDERLRMILAGAVPSPRGLRPEITETMARVVMRCLRPLPEERFATAQQLAEALAHAESEAAGIVRPRPALLNATGVTAVLPDAVRRAVQREVEVKQGFGSAEAVSVSPNNLVAAPLVAQQQQQQQHASSLQTDRMERPTVMQPAVQDATPAPNAVHSPHAAGPSAGGGLNRTLLSESAPVMNNPAQAYVQTVASPPGNAWVPGGGTTAPPPQQTASGSFGAQAAHTPAGAWPMSGTSHAYAPAPKKRNGPALAIALVVLLMGGISAVGVAALLWFKPAPPAGAGIAPASPVIASTGAPTLAPSAGAGAPLEPLPALSRVAKKKPAATAASRTGVGGADAGVAVAATVATERVADQVALINPLVEASPSPDAGAAPKATLAPATAASAALPAAPTPSAVPAGKPKTGKGNRDVMLGF